jgi:hypothetical protein
MRACAARAGERLARHNGVCEHGSSKGYGGLGGLRMGLLFWFLMACAAGFARYFFLARKNGDRSLASAAACGFVLVCAAALMELLGMLP